MTAVAVTLIDPGMGEEHQQELATRLSEAPASRDHDRQPQEETFWRVLAQDVRAAAPERAADRSVSSLDYAPWHAHLAGTRRWVPGGDGQPA